MALFLSATIFAQMPNRTFTLTSTKAYWDDSKKTPIKGDVGKTYTFRTENQNLYVNTNKNAHTYIGFENGFYVYQRTHVTNVGYGGILNTEDTYRIKKDGTLVIRENVNWDDSQDLWTNYQREIIIFE